MGFWDAFFKFGARSTNDAVARQRKKKVHTSAFSQTGKDIAKAKKENKYIDCKKTYAKNSEKQKSKIDRQHKTVENFINDL